MRSGPVRQRLAPADGADLVVFYGGEQEGELGTCGCPVNPRGSVARVDGYLRAWRRADPDTPSVLLNTGAWLSNTIGDRGQLRDDTEITNRYMSEALEIGGWDVLNVGFRDMPHFREHPLPDNAVSANIRPRESGGPQPFTVVEAGDYRVAITGVSTLGMPYIQPETHSYDEPIAALQALLPEMHAQADLVIVLGYDLERLAAAITALDVDVLIEAGEFKEQYDPVVQDGTVWVRSRWRTERLGELRLFLDEGRIAAARDRMIDMDELVPASRTLRRLERRAGAEIDASLQAQFGGR